MAVMSDSWIIKMAREKGMIEPFAPEQVKKGISFGVSSYGYDFRISNEFKIFAPHMDPTTALIDPKNFSNIHFSDLKSDVCDIPPNSYVLGRTVEYFRIPRDVLTIAYGKSTYARCGVFIHVTPFEPEWEGYATIAISNSTPYPARIYANEGIGQLIFLDAKEVCAISYADKKGKYQAQREVTTAKI